VIENFSVLFYQQPVKESNISSLMLKIDLGAELKKIEKLKINILTLVLVLFIKNLPYV